MGYQYKGSQDGAVLPVEQARRRNAELRHELAALTAENDQLEMKARAVREDLTAEYRKLAQKIRQLDAVRAQADLMAAAKQFKSNLPEPVYGGREGLQAAADEMKAHEDKHLKLSKPPRPAKSPSHGASSGYTKGCRCAECVAWNSRRSAQRRSNRKREMAAA